MIYYNTCIIFCQVFELPIKNPQRIISLPHIKIHTKVRLSSVIKGKTPVCAQAEFKAKGNSYGFLYG